MKFSSIWNRLTFGWVSGELYQGYMHDEDYSMNCINELVHAAAPVGYIEMPLLRYIFRSYKLQIIMGGALKLAGDISSVYSVRLIKSIVEGFKNGQDQNQSISSLLQLLLIHMLHTFGFNHHDYLMNMIGFQVRNQLSKQVYAKCLSLNNITDRGMVMNLFSSDVFRVSLLFGSLHNIWVSPFPVFWILYSLYELLGWYSLVGFSVTFLYVPAQYWLTKKMQEVRKKASVITDKRLSVMEEILNSIKYIKASCMESLFETSVESIRSKELSALRAYHILKGLALALSIFIPVLACCLTLLLVFTGKNRPSGIAIVSMIALFRILRNHVTMLPLVLNALSDALMSIKRLESFFLKQNDVVETRNKISYRQDGSLVISHDEEEFIVKPGDLVQIVGSPAKCETFFTELQHCLESAKVSVVHVNPAKPWLQELCIRDNITSLSVYDALRYESVIQACQLIKDFETTDDVLVKVAAPNGANISGGQRQRVCLARAIYSDAKVLLIGDIFVSIDFRTAKSIRRNCLEGLLKGRTRFVHDPEMKLENASLRMEMRDDDTSRVVLLNDKQSSGEFTIKLEPVKSAKAFKSPRSSSVLNYNGQNHTWSWILDCGGAIFVLTSIVLVIGINWTRVESEKMVTLWRGNPAVADLLFCTLFCMLQGLLPLLLSFLFTFQCTKGSRSLHKRALHKVLGTFLYYHVDTPAANIINRFGRDQEVVDVGLIITSRAFVVMLGVLVFTTKAIFDVRKVLLVPLGIMFAGYLPLLAMYLKAIKFAKKEESRRRTPLISFALSTIDGQETIRGLRLVEKFQESMKTYILFQSQSRAFAIASDAWFCLRIELLGNIATFLIGIGSIFFNVEPALAAFAINYANSLSGLAMWTIRQWTLTAANMISYGRVLELTKLPPESRNDLPVHSNVALLFQGDIVIYGLSASFRPDMTPVLRNLYLHIHAGKTIGIWGRTGSGKSSLLLSLLGFLTVVKGHIWFDGADRDKIDLTFLRRQIGYVGQDAVCFDGSLRFNLDPFGCFSDDLLHDLLDALELALNLGDDIMECAKSVHELVCFGRVILGRQRVILLDEPLASVESSAVRRILQHPFIKRTLSDATVILTSHRPVLLGYCDNTYQMADGQIVYDQ